MPWGYSLPHHSPSRHRQAPKARRYLSLGRIGVPSERSLLAGVEQPQVRGPKHPRAEGPPYFRLALILARTAENNAPAPPTSASTTVGFSGESVHPVCARSSDATSRTNAQPRKSNASSLPHVHPQKQVIALPQHPIPPSRRNPTAACPACCSSSPPKSASPPALLPQQVRRQIES